MKDPMPEFIRRNDLSVLSTYKRQPFAFKSGKGAVLTDVRGKKYLDFLSGIAVTNLGHCHPAVTKALKAQAGKLLHVSNIFVLPEQVALAETLTKLSGLAKAFFCNSGAEANEAAIKFARHASLAIHQDSNRYEIICMEHSFHGRTLGALSATMQPAYQNGFGPLVPGFSKVPFNDIVSLENAITPQTCAIFLEPLQAEGGMTFPSTGYLKAVWALCQKHDLLLILDEVQVGNGRTGRYFAFEHYGIKPDIVTLAKGLASGVPIGATLVSAAVAKTITPGLHASTFGGNPFSTVAAMATVKAIANPALLKKVREEGKYLLKLASDIKKSSKGLLSEVRGLGFFVALEFTQEVDGTAFVADCLARGLIVNVVKNKVIRLVPPFVATKAQLTKGMQILQAAILDWGKKV